MASLVLALGPLSVAAARAGDIRPKTGPTTIPATQPATPWRSLFDGKSLAGWKAGGRSFLALLWVAFAAWVVVNGPSGNQYAMLARGWGIHPSEAIAFGDMPNDLEMFRWAGHSVAMDNAEPEVKAAATEVGADHNDDAVAQILERWF